MIHRAGCVCSATATSGGTGQVATFSTNKSDIGCGNEIILFLLRHIDGEGCLVISHTNYLLALADGDDCHCQPGYHPWLVTLNHRHSTQHNHHIYWSTHTHCGCDASKGDDNWPSEAVKYLDSYTVSISWLCQAIRRLRPPFIVSSPAYCSTSTVATQKTFQSANMEIF